MARLSGHLAVLLVALAVPATAHADTTPAARAGAYLRHHAGALGLTGADIDALPAPRRIAGPRGLQQVRWTQAYRGIPAFRGELKVNLDGDGRVLGGGGGARHGLRVASIVPRLDAAGALRAAGATGALTVAAGPAGPRRDTTFTNGDEARLVLYGDRLAWRGTPAAPGGVGGAAPGAGRHPPSLGGAAGPAAADVVVDAATGAELHRASLVRDAAPALVWEQYPGAPAGGDARRLDLEDLHYLPAGATTLSSPRIHAFADLADNGPDAADEIHPGSDGFAFPFQPFPTGPGCASAPCAWDPTHRSTSATNRNQAAVQAFYLANVYLDHLRALVPGFQSGDQLQLRSDDGASTLDLHHDNASMETHPPGHPSIMRMYLWGIDLGLRAIDGADDAAILFHEYTHELDNREVADADGVSTLDDDQAGALDEGLADWFAKSFLAREGYQADDPGIPGEVDMGVYTDATRHAIRTEGLDCPVGAVTAACPAGGYTYGDFGRVAGGPEFHADGEIWAQTLWDLRTEITGPVAEEIVAAALPLAADDPSFLDMRDAILQAAEALHPQLVDRIWAVFAHRGMGFYASTRGSADDDPEEDDATRPPSGGPTGAIAGTVTDDSGQPVAGLAVSISGSPAHTVLTDAAGRYVLAGLPVATYDRILFRKGGYAQATASAAVQAGATARLDERLARDWAATAGGAFVVGDPGGPCGPADALDGKLSTGWSAQYSGGFPSPSMTIALPAAVDVSRVEALPAAVCGDDSGAAAKGYRIEVSAGDGAYQTVLQGELTAP